MAAVTLTRIEPANRMFRFYHLDVQPDLFGAWCCLREWGRIGSPGRVRSAPYATAAAAAAARDRQQRAKERRGYRCAK